VSTAATIAFFIFALIALGAAWGVVTSRNIVHSAFFLALSFIGVAALYFLLDATFLGAVQVLVYAGAVAIMVVFAVMLTLRGEVSESNLNTRNWKWAAVVAGLTFVVLMLVILGNTDWRIIPDPVTGTDVGQGLSQLLLTSYMVPFEAAAFVITMTLIGAVILAKGVKEDK